MYLAIHTVEKDICIFFQLKVGRRKKINPLVPYVKEDLNLMVPIIEGAHNLKSVIGLSYSFSVFQVNREASKHLTVSFDGLQLLYSL